MGPLWSISVEEQFYISWPFVAKKFGRAGVVTLSLLLIPTSIAASAWLTLTAKTPGLAIWTNSLTNFESFGLGALIAVALHGRDFKPPLYGRCILFCAGLASWAASDGIFHFKRSETLTDRSQLPHILGFQLIVCGAVLLFISFLGAKPPRSTKPLLYLGRISYGLYVFHILARYLAMRAVSLSHSSPVFVLPLAFCITVALAATSFRFYEQPFNRLKQRFAFVKAGARDRPFIS